jgi:hypothetical protein
MQLRVLMTNGLRTVELIWLEHTGTDIYYGGVGWDTKDSYHASGKRHEKSKTGKGSEMQNYYRLANFKGQLQLCVFAIGTGIVEDSAIIVYKGKKADSIIWLDTRTLPNQINVSLGLLEVGAYHAILPVHLVTDLCMVHLVTNAVPWIYIMVSGEPGSFDD